MNFFFVAFATFCTLPLLEIFLLISIGQNIGALNTIILIILTATLGAILVRSEGLSTFLRIQEIIARGEIPAIELIEGGILLVSAILLLTPGFVTDSIGLLGLIPTTRRLIANYILKKVILRRHTSFTRSNKTFDVDYKIEDK